MNVLGFSHKVPDWRRAWSELLEDRFTNSDIVMFAGALLIAGFVGALTGAALLG